MGNCLNQSHPQQELVGDAQHKNIEEKDGARGPDEDVIHQVTE
jgi:hypothetical protein